MDPHRSRYAPPTHKNPYDLRVDDLKDKFLDVYSFEGKEYLSRTFHYTLRFTCSEPLKTFTGSVYMTREDLENAHLPKNSPRDLDMPSLLNRCARFALYGKPPKKSPFLEIPTPPHRPLRSVFGVVTRFCRIGGSADQGQYQITLEPRLARLRLGKRCRIFQWMSVPKIVRQILEEHQFYVNRCFQFDLKREYPPREQVMQYDESDLDFIERLLAEVGIWYRFACDTKYEVEMVRFHDWQCHLTFGVELPCLAPGGLSSSEQDSVWKLRSHHQVVEKEVFFRSYDPRQADKRLQGRIDKWRIADTLYGENYEYAMPYTEMGELPTPNHPSPKSETAQFYALLSQERSLNQRSQLSGSTCSATLIPGQVLRVTQHVPQDFASNVLIHTLSVSAAPNKLYVAEFTGMPYSEFICFRPPLKPKPKISGTLPARVTTWDGKDPYANLDPEGRYKVQFLFDREQWPAGKESLWLRLARPYAGDTHGLHLPLVHGTEVAVAFEQGDPDRPYIAHALHDSRHPDPVAWDNRRRNVLRTPANNKLRMEDERGKEHIKVSTEFGGKSQLNLGHLVDSQRRKRGEGFELRSDHWGVLRAGKGLFISADAQPGAQGEVLDMAAAVDHLQRAGEQLQQLSADAEACQVEPADVQAQLKLLRQDLEQLKSAVLLLSAPQGVALSSGQHLQLAARDNLMLNAGGQADLSVVKRLFIGVGQGLSLFVRRLGIRLVANQGPVQLQAQNDSLGIMARQGLEITSTEDEIRIVAKKKITLNAGGSYLVLDPCRIEAGTEGDYNVKAPYVEFSGKARQREELPALPVLTDYQKKDYVPNDYSG